MNAIALGTPIPNEGLRTIHFFNGRLLSGEDLSQEQAAHREARQHLGRAVGDGTAYGLEVVETAGSSTPTSPVVTVSAGLAINRCGQTLNLAHNVDVSLVRPLNGATPTITGAVFAECQPPESGVYVAGAGVYLLTIAPAATSEGRAPVNGLGNATAPCNTRYTVDGMQFRLIQLSLTLAELSDARLRNLIAYRCFAPETRQSFVHNPFAPRPDHHGMLDDLRPKLLNDADVPLALIHWTTGGIQFVEMWSVRRRITRPTSSTGVREQLIRDERRISDAEAMVLQFAEHVDHLRATRSDLATVVATQIFHHLPPVGILPLSSGAVSGFNYEQFFSQRVYRGPIFLEGARVEHLFRTALQYPPIDLSGTEMLWLYVVRENRDPKAQEGALPPPYLIFTSGYVPFLGEARLNVARWNYNSAV
jgi:hypothetical protein